MPHEFPPPGDAEALRRYNEQVQLRLFKLVTEFLEVEGLTAQCAYFVQARICGYPYEPLNKPEEQITPQPGASAGTADQALGAKSARSRQKRGRLRPSG